MMSLWSLFSLKEGRSDLFKEELGVRRLNRLWAKHLRTGFKRFGKRTKRAKRRSKKPSYRWGRYWHRRGARVATNQMEIMLYKHKDKLWEPRGLKGGVINVVMKPDKVTLIGVESRGVGFYFLDPKEQEKDGLLTKSVTMTIGTSCVHSVKLEDIRNDGSLNFELVQKRKLKNNATKHLVVYGTNPQLVHSRAASLAEVVPYDAFTKKGILLTEIKEATWSSLAHNIQVVFDTTELARRNNQRGYQYTQEHGVDPRVRDFELSAPDYLMAPVAQPVWSEYGIGLPKMKRRNIKGPWSEGLPGRLVRDAQVKQENLSTRDDATFDNMVAGSTSLGKDSLAPEVAQGLHSPKGLVAGANYIKRMASVSGVQDTRDLASFQQYKTVNMTYEQRSPNATPQVRAMKERGDDFNYETIHRYRAIKDE